MSDFRKITVRNAGGLQLASSRCHASAVADEVGDLIDLHVDLEENPSLRIIIDPVDSLEEPEPEKPEPKGLHPQLAGGAGGHGGGLPSEQASVARDFRPEDEPPPPLAQPVGV